ncbi:MAG: hypothetical protein PSV22_23335 [Pseudolabrys sp.]|jgi:hypothetical protein|nr:hypothetical protein [Pseudolabrys sp.]
MTPDTNIRIQIAAVVYVMTSAVLFGAGLVFVLMVPALSAYAGLSIALVVAASVIVAAPISWLIAPRLRARYWRQRQSAPQLLAPTRSF